MTVFEVEKHPEFSALPPSALHSAQHEAGQSLARRLLARCSGREDIRIETDERGKPFTDEFFLSIAHSGMFVCAAVSEQPVGIDIERLRSFDGRIAARWFFPAERDWLDRAEDEQQRRERFFTLWTTKEALLKRSGEGLAGLGCCDTFSAMQGIRITKTVKDGYALALAETNTET